MWVYLLEKEANLLQKLVKNRQVEGLPIQAGEMTLIPVSQSLSLEFPGGRGGFSWNRPVGVRVSVPGQADQFLPVRDTTRITIFAIFGGVFGALLLTRMVRRMVRRR
jgi:hypothetical protein